MKMTLTSDEIAAILDLIRFHEDWDEVSEQVGTNVDALYDKLVAMLNDA